MYKLKDIIQFNPQEKLRKGIMARKLHLIVLCNQTSLKNTKEEVNSEMAIR